MTSIFGERTIISNPKVKNSVSNVYGANLTTLGVFQTESVLIVCRTFAMSKGVVTTGDASSNEDSNDHSSHVSRVAGSVDAGQSDDSNDPSYPVLRNAGVLVNMDDGTLLIYGGETRDQGASKALGDTWQLSPPEPTGWVPCSCPEPRWTMWECTAKDSEQVPTARSNHAAVVCGEYLLVFGGWTSDGRSTGTPLSHPELLHLDTRCWKNCSTANAPPPPRGNPTLVYSRKRHLVILHGCVFYDRTRAGDTWCLDMESWIWHEAANVDQPLARTEHTAVLWQVSSTDERMLVFGGSTEGGASAELWSLDCSSGAPTKWNWNDETNTTFIGSTMSGPVPSNRTSHAAAITGYGASAAMIICGGQGTKGAILSDAWVLSPLGGEARGWRRLDWGGTFPLRRCRHSLAVVNGLAIVYSGYDGASIIDAHHSLFAAPLDIATNGTANEGDEVEQWAAEEPVSVEDLPKELRAKALASTMPLAMAKTLHRFAVAQSPPNDTYIDPDSGFSVFTQTCLKRRPCCGNGCRHCPWGHENVPVYCRERYAAQAQGLLEW